MSVYLVQCRYAWQRGRWTYVCRMQQCVHGHEGVFGVTHARGKSVADNFSHVVKNAVVEKGHIIVQTTWSSHGARAICTSMKRLFEFENEFGFYKTYSIRLRAQGVDPESLSIPCYQGWSPREFLSMSYTKRAHLYYVGQQDSQKAWCVQNYNI